MPCCVNAVHVAKCRIFGTFAAYKKRVARDFAQIAHTKKKEPGPPPLPSLPGRALLLPAAPQQSQRGAGVMVMLCGMLCGDTCGKSWAWRSGDGVRESEGRGALESRGKRAGGGMACGVSLLRFRASSDSVRRGRLLVPALLLLPVINGFLQA